MAITVNDDSVILDDGVRLKFLRDAEYDAAPPLVALASDVQTLLQCTPDGKLKVDASISIGSIDIGAVDMQAKDSGNVSRYLQVVTDPVISRYALVVNDPRMTFVGDRLAVNVDLASAGDTINVYGEATAVAAFTDQTVVSYVVPALMEFYLSSVMASGTNAATFRVVINSSTVAKKRTYYTGFNADFNLASPSGVGTKLVAGDTVLVKAVHANALASGDFNATITGQLVSV